VPHFTLKRSLTVTDLLDPDPRTQTTKRKEKKRC